ncbi:helix-turn-helix domain-containing protein [Eggerthella lenta]|uniref:helix-turn-helix domain-containing protein n=1 Tax=Eggerthella lenta TaxID=84112 RepID=UPI000DF77956|nr:AraC family transcriptional regulator [Eggerthella lenta]RDC03488.1 hypothetical protein C1863_11440 [Eggerthella lenta]
MAAQRGTPQQRSLERRSISAAIITYVSKRFKEAVGCTMKTYASIIRTQNAIRFLSDSRYRGVTGLDIGTGLGYYDQSHFDREFKKYTTLVPGDIRAGRSTVLFH